MKKKTIIIVTIIIAIICIAILLRYVFYSGTSRIIRYVSYEEENKTNLEKNTENGRNNPAMAGTHRIAAG